MKHENQLRPTEQYLLKEDDGPSVIASLGYQRGYQLELIKTPKGGHIYEKFLSNLK